MLAGWLTIRPCAPNNLATHSDLATGSVLDPVALPLTDPEFGGFSITTDYGASNRVYFRNAQPTELR